MINFSAYETLPYYIKFFFKCKQKVYSDISAMAKMESWKFNPDLSLAGKNPIIGANTWYLPVYIPAGG